MCVASKGWHEVNAQAWLTYERFWIVKGVAYVRNTRTEYGLCGIDGPQGGSGATYAYLA